MPPLLFYKRKLFYFLGFLLVYLKKYGLTQGLFMWSFLHRSSQQEGALLKISLQDQDSPIYIRSLSPDVGTFEHVFVWDAYNIELPFSPSTILDLGANIGLASRWYAKKYPDATIYAIEPDSANYQVLQSNLSADAKFYCIQAVVGAHDGFGSCENPAALSHSFRFSATDKSTDLPVKSIRTILHDAEISEIDLVKMDIEGAEEDIFADTTSLRGWLPYTKAIAVEIHTTRARQLILTAMPSSEWHHVQKGDTDFFIRHEHYSLF